MSAAFLSRFSDRISVVGRDGSVVKGEVSGNGTVMASPGQLRSVGGGVVAVRAAVQICTQRSRRA